MGFYRSDGYDVKTLLDVNGVMYGLAVYENGQMRSYYFVNNAQGDVIGLYSYISGSVVATYDYDAWGNCTVKAVAADDHGHAVSDANHIANLNPFRYRGYYYDTETGLYYLNSRYYDPQTGRFLNADAYLGANAGAAANNIIAYCGNNPVNYIDSKGAFVSAIVGGIIGGIAGGVVAVFTGQDVLTGVCAGAAGGAIAGLGVDLAVATFGASAPVSACLVAGGFGAIGGMTSNFINQAGNYYVKNDTFSGFAESFNTGTFVGAAITGFCTNFCAGISGVGWAEYYPPSGDTIFQRLLDSGIDDPTAYVAAGMFTAMAVTFNMTEDAIIQYIDESYQK